MVYRCRCLATLTLSSFGPWGYPSSIDIGFVTSEYRYEWPNSILRGRVWLSEDTFLRWYFPIFFFLPASFFPPVYIDSRLKKRDGHFLCPPEIFVIFRFFPLSSFPIFKSSSVFLSHVYCVYGHISCLGYFMAFCRPFFWPFFQSGSQFFRTMRGKRKFQSNIFNHARIFPFPKISRHSFNTLSPCDHHGFYVELTPLGWVRKYIIIKSQAPSAFFGSMVPEKPLKVDFNLI